MPVFFLLHKQASILSQGSSHTTCPLSKRASRNMLLKTLRGGFEGSSAHLKHESWCYLTNTPHVEISLCWQETLYQCECKFILVIRYCTERSANFLHFAQHVCFHVNFHPHKQQFFGPHSHMSTWVPKVLDEDLFAFPLIWLYICIYIHTNYFRDRHSSQDFNQKK